MENTKQTKSSREDITDSLKLWSEKRAEAVKKKDTEAIKLANTMLDRYLDDLNSLPQGL